MDVIVNAMIKSVVVSLLIFLKLSQDQAKLIFLRMPSSPARSKGRNKATRSRTRAPAYQYYETGMGDYLRGRQKVITIASD